MTRRWGLGIAVVIVVIAVGMGLAVASDGGFGPTRGGMMSGNSIGTGMMGGAGGTSGGSGSMMGGSGSMMGGSGSMMGNGSMGAGMMDGVDMDAMHDQMMSSMAGTVPAGMLARCETMHDRMMSSVASGDAAAGIDHASHHAGATT